MNIKVAAFTVSEQANDVRLSVKKGNSLSDVGFVYMHSLEHSK